VGFGSKWMGVGHLHPVADPNPQLEMVIDVARLGVRVRLLLDSYVDDGENLLSNRATLDYVRSIAAEGLDLDARQ
jgi:hypothetical protein